MTVIGDDLIRHCPECYSVEGYSIPLVQRSGKLVCSRNSLHCYCIKAGLLERT